MAEYPGQARDTIFALASGAGKAAISILRLSGSGVAGVLAALCGKLPKPRRATLCRLRGQTGEILDDALVLFMPGPGSFTGEDCGEVFVHGGRAVIAAVSQALVQFGARPAEPGEFARRGFLNGRMDLLAAEGIADLIDAQTEMQRRQAMRQVTGAQARLLSDWTERLRQVLAAQEALIDFPDEDLPPEVEQALCADIAALRAEMAQAKVASTSLMRIRDGLTIAVIGPPNAGKSSLINALTEREVAITAATPGTTRDALEVAVEIAGVPVTLVDTAGLRETADPVEAEGVRRAHARMVMAELVVRVRDASAGFELSEPMQTDPRRVLRVANKIDLTRNIGADEIGVSAATGEGIGALRDALVAWVEGELGQAAPAGFTQLRHVAALRDAGEALRQAQTAARPELRGEDLRVALAALARITGAVDVEAVLDAVFSRFCIGK